jgi:spore maturation protein CgeB
MPTVLIVAGTQLTSSDLHLLFRRAFERLGWRAVFLSHDSELPSAERVFQQAGLASSRLRTALFNRRLRRLASQTRPDLLLISGSNWLVLPETLRDLRRRFGCLIALNEQHLQVFRPHQVQCLPLYDHVFTQDGGLAALLQASSPARSVSLLGPACDPAEHCPVPLSPEETQRFEADVCYLGWGYPNRIALFESLLGFQVSLWGMGWNASERLRPFFRPEPVYGLKKTKIYNATRVNLNVQSTHYQLDGVTCRPFEIAACGGFCLAEPRRDLARYFRPGVEIVTFEGAEDLRTKVGYYLAHEDERREIAARGRARALAEHTYEHRVREILTTLRFI